MVLDNCLHIEGRLENADLPLDSKHPLILPGRHPLTVLIVQYQHEQAGHGGPAYTLMKTRERFWIIHGISSVKFYIANCGKCALLKAKPVRQLMADLPSCRIAVCNKPVKFTGLDYLGPYSFRQNRSDCKAWGLLFTCLCTRCLHVELVTSLTQTAFFLLSLALLICVGQWTLFSRTTLRRSVPHLISCQNCWGLLNLLTRCVS